MKKSLNISSTEREKLLHKRIVSFLLIFMGLQYVPMEGPLISWPKIIVMTLCFMVALLGEDARGFIFAGLYYATICMTSFLHPYPLNYTSILYTIPFMGLFGGFYAILHTGDFTLDDFEKTIKYFLYAFIICLILQQVCYLIGWGAPLIINRWKDLGFRFQSLALEPSYAARITGAYMLAFLEIQRLKTGKVLSVKQLWTQEKRLFIGCLYMLTTLGSGTAWGVLLLLGAYFTCFTNPLISVAGVCALFFIPDESFEGQSRLLNVIEATSTLDMKNVVAADPSASVRIACFFDFVRGFKPLSAVFWTGQGHYKYILPNIGIIQIYGFPAWVMQMIMFRVCAFRSFISFEFLYFVIFCVIGIGNVVNHWAIIMVFVTLKYFYDLKKDEKR